MSPSPRRVRISALPRGELPHLRLDPEDAGSGRLHAGCAGAVSTLIGLQGREKLRVPGLISAFSSQFGAGRVLARPFEGGGLQEEQHLLG